MNFLSVVEQVFVLGIVMLLGFIICKTGYVEAKAKDSISKLIVNLILPCLIISSVSKQEFKSEMLGEIFLVIVMSVFCIGTLFFIGVFTAKLLNIPHATQSVHKLLMSLGNVIFIGFPIITSVYGEEGFFYAIVYWMINDLTLWTIGVLMFSQDKSENSYSIKKLANPNTISFLIATIMFIFGIKLPPVIHRAAEEVGALTTHLSMIFIGMALAAVNIKAAMKKWWIFLVAPIKLVIMPVVFIFIFKSFGIKEVVLGTIVLEAAMPAQTVLTILANEHKADYEYAAVGMFITTVLSLVTLPFVCYCLKVLV